MALLKDDRQNYIINGNFDIWQRDTTFTGVSNNDYTADRFQYLNQNTSAVHDIVREGSDSPVDSATYTLSSEVTTADASLSANSASTIRYDIEGNDFQHLFNKTFSLGFWVKATKTGTYCVSFRNDAADRSYIAEYTIDTTDTWEFKEITVQHSLVGTWLAGSQTGLRVDFVLAAGTDYETTANSWQSGNYLSTSNQVNALDATNNFFKLSQIQLVEGEQVSQNFQRAGITIGGEEALCRRYYQLINFAQSNTTRSYFSYPAPMRGNPTVTAIGGDTAVFTGVANLQSYGVTINKTSSNNGFLLELDAELN